MDTSLNVTIEEKRVMKNIANDSLQNFSVNVDLPVEILPHLYLGSMGEAEHHAFVSKAV